VKSSFLINPTSSTFSPVIFSYSSFAKGSKSFHLCIALFEIFSSSGVNSSQINSYIIVF
jgi:hypothetical protein